MHPLEPSVSTLLVPAAIAWLMAFVGVKKRALEWRRRPRVCPSCGLDSRSCRC